MKAGNGHYDGPHDLPADVALFPLRGALLLPGGALPLVVYEPRYLAMVDDALSGDRLIGIIQPRLDVGEDEDAGDAPLVAIGCTGRITAFSETGDGRYQLVLTGIARFRLLAETPAREDEEDGAPYRVARVSYDFPVDFAEDRGEAAVDRDAFLKVFRAYLDANDLSTDWQRIEETSTEELVNALAMMSPYGPREKQALLEAPDLGARAETLMALTEMDLVRSASTGDDRSALN